MSYSFDRIKLSTKDSTTISTGDSIQFSTSSCGPKEWKVSNTKKAKITPDGKFTAKRSGTVLVTVISCGKISNPIKVKMSGEPKDEEENTLYDCANALEKVTRYEKEYNEHTKEADKQYKVYKSYLAKYKDADKKIELRGLSYTQKEKLESQSQIYKVEADHQYKVYEGYKRKYVDVQKRIKTEKLSSSKKQKLKVKRQKYKTRYERHYGRYKDNKEKYDKTQARIKSGKMSSKQIQELKEDRQEYKERYIRHKDRYEASNKAAIKYKKALDINLNILEKLANLYGYKIDYFVTGSEIKEPDIQIAFRGENLCNEDLKTIAWAKTFLNNLGEMNDLIKE